MRNPESAREFHRTATLSTLIDPGCGTVDQSPRSGVQATISQKQSVVRPLPQRDQGEQGLISSRKA